jgi:hypothetical protein
MVLSLDQKFHENLSALDSRVIGGRLRKFRYDHPVGSVFRFNKKFRTSQKKFAKKFQEYSDTAGTIEESAVWQRLAATSKKLSLAKRKKKRRSAPEYKKRTPI